MNKRHVIGVVVLCILLIGALATCIFVLFPRGQSQKPSLTMHGISSNMNIALDHLPKLKDAYVVDESVVFPVALFNGALPLIMIHVGESGSMAAAIIDTGSEMLLLADTERCKTCSSELFGGARGSDSANDRRHGSGVIVFGSQKDHVEFRQEDIFIDEFNIPSIKFGLVTDRQSLTKGTNITYNIMGIGGAQKLPHALLNQIHNKLRPNKARQFGFMLGNSGNDFLDDDGVFVVGPFPKMLLDDKPIVKIPLHTNPLSTYYYTSEITSCTAHLRDKQSIKYAIRNFPIMFDSGSNYSDFPKAMSQHFGQLESIELVFDNHTSLFLPNSGLMWNRRASSPLVTFTDTTIITIGTIMLSKFKAFEFILDPSPLLNIYKR